MENKRKEHVIKCLKRSRISIVSNETGIAPSTLDKIASRDINNPGSDSIETLYDYFVCDRSE